MSTDEEVEQLLRRTRAARERVNTRMAAIGESGHPIRSPLRSPLKERSNVSSSPSRTPIKSPIKTSSLALSPTKYKSPYSSPYKSRASPTRQPSPIRTMTSSYKSPLKVTKNDDGDFKSEETYNREVTEKKTTIDHSPVIKGNTETYKKTVVTEKEETIQKTEVLKFTEVTPASKSAEIDPMKLLEERRNRRRKDAEHKTVAFDDKEKVHEISIVDSPAPDLGRSMGSPSKFGSCRDISPEKDNGWTPNKNTIRYKFSTDVDGESNECETGAEGRKKRLRAIANKFREYDEDEEEIVQAKLVADAASTQSPSKRHQTKIVDVDKEISTSPRRGRSPTKRQTNPNPDLVKSLKAQGFEESDSKTKLTYDFKDSPSRYRSNSPTKTSGDGPYKANPHQFICPQKSSPMPSSTTTSGAGYRSVSPTRMVDPGKASSPYTPHPLQFVSPKRANSPVKQPAPPPPKPQRNFDNQEEVTFRTEVTISPSKNVSPTKQQFVPAEKSDTASRRSILEKRTLFEKAGSPTKNSTDPAMLPLSQRRALFEKNRSAVRPIARFGESVTPAMLAAQTPDVKIPKDVPSTEPAWKRKREVSPQRYLTPAGKKSPSKDLTSIHKRFEKSRKLFENVNTQSDNDIAKATAEAKKKDMDLLRARFRTVEGGGQERVPSPKFKQVKSPEPEREKTPEKEQHYPGVNSLKRIKVSPPKPGQLYPDLHDMVEERPETGMSGESCAISEAPSLGTAIKRAASHNRMPSISEDVSMHESVASDQINDMLDEALDISMSPTRSAAPTANVSTTEDSEDVGPTPPKAPRISSSSARSPTSSATSWEYTPQLSAKEHDFKTPRVDNISSPSRKQLPCVETEDGEVKPANDLMYTVSFYRKQKPALNLQVTPHSKIVRNPSVSTDDDQIVEERKEEDVIADRIRKLLEEVEEQTQRRLQSSKALDVCASKNEFEGSSERVEFERLLLEAHHKYSAASAEIRRLKTEGARRMSMGEKSATSGRTCRGALSISGITLPLKRDFVKMVGSGSHDSVHYFMCLVKYRAQVIATQMLSTVDGITRGSNLVFSNLISVNDLDFDFQIYLEVYGLQTPKEKLTHEAKYHIRKGKSMFNLTPLKKLKRHEPARNPVNSLTIRKSKFGLVGYTTITIETLAQKTFELQSVPARSPLEGDLGVKLNVDSESNIEERGFLTLFMDVNGFGNWCRRWCLLQDNTLFFWKYPEDEGKKAPSEQIPLHNVVTETPVTLAPREICSRFNTFMLENQRPIQAEDKDTLNIVSVNAKKGVTTMRHLLCADTRDERLNWCAVLTSTLENMRAWDPSSYRPRAASTTSSSTVATASSIDADASSANTDIW